MTIPGRGANLPPTIRRRPTAEFASSRFTVRRAWRRPWSGCSMPNPCHGRSAAGPLVDWPPRPPALVHFSFVGRRAEAGEARAALLAAEAAAAEREELNLLYVAITRARQVFIASGSQSTRAPETTPCVRLACAETSGCYDGCRPTRALLPDALPDSHSEAAVDAPSTPAGFALDPGGYSRSSVVGERRAARTPLPASASCCTPFSSVERRGRGRHPADGVPEGQASWWQAMGYSDGELATRCRWPSACWPRRRCNAFFSPGCYRRAWNEVEFTDSSGNLFRIDRLVEDDERSGCWTTRVRARILSVLMSIPVRVGGYWRSCRSIGKW